MINLKLPAVNIEKIELDQFPAVSSCCRNLTELKSAILFMRLQEFKRS